MTQVLPKPMIGDVLDRPLDPKVKRAFYTNVPNALKKIDIQQQVVPDIVEQAKPRGVGDNILDLLKQAVQQQGGDDTKKAMPSDLAWRG